LSWKIFRDAPDRSKFKSRGMFGTRYEQTSRITDNASSDQSQLNL